MSVESLERKFFELKGKLDVGVITEEQFKSEVEKLRFQDSTGRWWMIGAQSGKWYSFDGARWIPGTPPHDQPTPAEPKPAAAPVVAQPIVTPLASSQPATVTPLSEPPPEKITPPKSIAPPPQPEHIQPTTPALRMRPIPLNAQAQLRRFPIPGWMLVLGAAAVAMVGVVIFWIIVENFVPGKPISSFLNNVTGVKPVATVIPGSVTISSAGSVSKDVSTILAMGDQLVTQSQIDGAITQYQNAATLAPTSALPLTRWSRALVFKGLTQEAVTKAQQAIQRAPNDAETLAQFCRALIWNGQSGDGIAQCEKATQLDPKNANAYAFLTEAYLLARRSTDAQARAQLALQLAPQSVEAHRAQAWFLTMQGQKDQALVEWRQTVSMEPSFYFRHFELGEVLRVYFNNPAEAVTEYQTALALYGGYIPTVNRLGQALLAVNKPKEAIPHFQRALTLEPGNVDNYVYLGIAFGQSNQCGQAIPYFQQALRLSPENAIARKGLSDCQAGKAPTLAAAPPPQVPLIPPIVAPKP
ncbi:MAG: tetratricopeptide repeat protein [Chloroflexi bacterium]|nr:tetratricopeptide repeat protein [Chloroflexota bacterium]